MGHDWNALYIVIRVVQKENSTKKIRLGDPKRILDFDKV